MDLVYSANSSFRCSNRWCMKLIVKHGNKKAGEREWVSEWVCVCVRERYRVSVWESDWVSFRVWEQETIQISMFNSFDWSMIYYLVK